jgi:xylulokinase
VSSIIPELLAAAGVVPGDVKALATSGMVPAVVCLGDDQTVLRAAILQSDARATREIHDLGEQLAEVDLLRITGSALTQQSVAPTLAWLARHEPELRARMTGVCGSYEWASRALGAGPFAEYNWAIESGLFDLDGKPVGAVLDAADVDPAWLGPVHRTGEVVGEVSAEAATATGLDAGTPIVVGGADHVLAAFAAGVSEPGDVLVKLGGAGDILAVADHPVFDARLYLDSHPQPGRWLPNGCMATSGSLVRWLQQLVGAPELQTLDEEAAACAPAEVLCLPYFLGEKSPLHDPELRGAFAGLHLGHGRGDLHRSVLEAVCYGFRHHFEVLAELGIDAATVRVSNGGSGSTLWKQILADVLGQPVVPITGHLGASYGAALAAGIGIGLIPDWDLSNLVSATSEPVTPTPRHAKIYHQAYASWRELGQAVAPTSHLLARRFGGDI